MIDKPEYVVLGAGRQGTAAAYDFARWGEAGRVILADQNLAQANKAVERVNQLMGRAVAEPVQVDAGSQEQVMQVLSGAHACLSAVPYYYNLGITRAALQAKVNLCDLGGNTDIARQQHRFAEEARQAGVSIIPNCGQVPGMGTSLMVYAMELLDEATDLYMWDGGLPQKPRPPFNYLLTFHVAGLTNEYAERPSSCAMEKSEVEPMTG
jgi:lysine 6-dehydrogenase